MSRSRMTFQFHKVKWTHTKEKWREEGKCSWKKGTAIKVGHWKCYWSNKDLDIDTCKFFGGNKRKWVDGRFLLSCTTPSIPFLSTENPTSPGTSIECVWLTNSFVYIVKGICLFYSVKFIYTHLKWLCTLTFQKG